MQDFAKGYFSKSDAGSAEVRTAIRHLEALKRYDEADRLRDRAGIPRSSPASSFEDPEPPDVYRDTWRRYRTLAAFRRSGFGFHRLTLPDVFAYWSALSIPIPYPDIELSAYAVLDNVQIEMHIAQQERQSRANKGPKPRK